MQSVVIMGRRNSPPSSKIHLKRKYSFCGSQGWQMPEFNKPEQYWFWKDKEHFKAGVTIGLAKRDLFTNHFNLDMTSSSNPVYLEKILAYCTPLTQKQLLQLDWEGKFKQFDDAAEQHIRKTG
jgi:hypothetical protein